MRGDVDIAGANECMKKGLAALDAGKTIPGEEQLVKPDVEGQLFDLAAEFFTSDMKPEEAQKKFADIMIAGK